MQKFKALFLLLFIGSQIVFAQTKTVTGTVKDIQGIPLPGVTVVVKGTTMGTITDIDGQFKFSVPANTKTLVFSFVGMVSLEITLGNQASLTIVLEEATGRR